MLFILFKDQFHHLHVFNIRKEIKFNLFPTIKVQTKQLQNLNVHRNLKRRSSTFTIKMNCYSYLLVKKDKTKKLNLKNLIIAYVEDL